MFKNGCPMCGYSAPPPSKQPKIRPKKPQKARKHHASEPLPFWTYAVAFIALFAAILLLSHLITK